MFEKLRADFEDEIYRPGTDVSELENLTEEQMSDRRKEITEIFNNPEAFIVDDE